MRWRGSAREARDAPLRLGVARRCRAGAGDHPRRAGPAALHPVHGRFPLGDPRQRGPHGPGGPPRHRAGAGTRCRAMQMATINTAEHFGVSRDIGQIAPGRFADVLLVKDLRDFRPRTSLPAGTLPREDGQAAPRPSRGRVPGVGKGHRASPPSPVGSGLPAGCAAVRLRGDGARHRRDGKPGADGAPGHESAGAGRGGQGRPVAGRRQARSPRPASG